MVFTSKFVYIAHHFFLLVLNPFSTAVDGQEWRFEHSVSQLLVRSSVESTKQVFWSWLSSLPDLGGVTMAFNGKIVGIALHFIFLSLNPLTLMLIQMRNVLAPCIMIERLIIRRGFQLTFPDYLCFEYWVVWLEKNNFKLTYITDYFILLLLNPFGLDVDGEGWRFEHSVSQLQN